jgi:integrase
MRWDAFTLDTVYDHANREAWSNDTKRTRMTALKTLSNYGAKTFGLKDNLIGLQLPTKRRREKHVTREEYNQLVDGVFACNRKSTYGFAMFLAVLWHTGARPGELMSAEVSQFDGSRIVLTKHKNERKSEKPRVIYLTPPAVVAVKMSIDGRGAGKIFCDSRGNPLRKDSLRNRLNRILKAQNMDMSIVAYSFRHGYATRALEAGVDVATLAELMGTSVEMIGKNYGHLDARRDFLAQKAMMVR